MIEHIAIVDPQTAERLLDGSKTIESRFSQTRRAPYGLIGTGQLIHFKLAGGGIIGSCRAQYVRQYDELTPERVDFIRTIHGGQICASAEYWEERLRCRYGVLIGLGRVRPAREAVEIPRQYGNGWITLPNLVH